MKSQTKNASKRNGTISLVKFLAAILVMIYHGGRILIGKNHNFSLQTGYVLVDLFTLKKINRAGYILFLATIFINQY